jgi:uncharacterized protein (DUF1499 family)
VRAIATSDDNLMLAGNRGDRLGAGVQNVMALNFLIRGLIAAQQCISTQRQDDKHQRRPLPYADRSRKASTIPDNVGAPVSANS